MNIVWLSMRLAVLVMIPGLNGCGGSDGTAPPVAALEIVQGTSCALDGMLLADYPGPKAQIHYAGREEPDWFCDTMEMFNIYHSPEQIRAVRAMYVQDMGEADWARPVGQWIDARAAFYVVGSRLHGSMGPTIASFLQRLDAEAFAAEYGGSTHTFDEITPEMARLDGGALHDSLM